MGRHFAFAVPLLKLGGCLVPARFFCCVVAVLLACADTSWGQNQQEVGKTPPSPPFVRGGERSPTPVSPPFVGGGERSFNPTSSAEKKVPLTSADIKPVETPKKSTVVVRHLEKKHDGYKVAETTHFRILHDQNKRLVDKVGEVAELTRAELQKKWFGDETTDWDGKCSIYLHPDRANYASKTKMKNTLGHMHTSLDWGGVALRSIHLPVSEASQVSDVLPHEVSHSVMAVRFQGQTPRWADEGMAMLAETPSSIAECVDRLPRYRQNDALFSLEVLMQTQEAEQYNTMEFYAQSTSLVQFFIARKGPEAFTTFLRTYISKGAEEALTKHYDIKGYADLEKRWQAFAFEKREPRTK